jgi:tripartite-type tricarboxylate transporter receptor subunit TctC
VSLLVAEVGKLVKDPSVVEKAERAGYQWIGAGPDALRQAMAAEVAQSQEVIRSAGLKQQ